jgi:Predicted Peptidoglycan domain
VGILQLSLGVAVDHSFGSITLAAVNAADSFSLLRSFKANLVTHAFNVVVAKPQTKIFLKGWADRINS